MEYVRRMQTTPPGESVAAVVLAELEKRGMTQAQLAEGSGIPLTTLHRRLRSKPSALTYDELSAIARVFGTQPAVLLAHAEKRSVA